MLQKANAVHAVHSDLAPRPGGHYSQAVVHHGIVYCSGQLPVDTGTGKLVQGAFEDQARAVLNNLAAVLAAAGSNLQCTLRTTAYLARIEDRATFDQVYARTFGGHRPARTVVAVGALHHGALIEIDAIATVL